MGERRDSEKYQDGIPPGAVYDYFQDVFFLPGVEVHQAFKKSDVRSEKDGCPNIHSSDKEYIRQVFALLEQCIY